MTTTTAQSTDPVLIEKHGPVTVVTLNRSDRLNALTDEASRSLLRTLHQLGDDEHCRAVVLTGAGRAFCAGVDLITGLDPGGDRGPVQGRHHALTRAAETFVTLREIPQPVIAAVHGHAVGAGLALAAMADIRIADTTARFNPVFTRLGFSGGDLGASWWLPRLIGFSNAAEILYTASSFGAEEAHRLGLVSRVVDEGTDVAAAIELATRIATNSPFGISQTKDLLNSAIGIGELRQHLSTETRAQILCSLTSDVGEGIAATMQRRTPVFTNT
ncbi:enoyl-CoA hydratase [Mycobacterium sp. MAA66]|uniref:enoyl-CoA hydratase/isomerase family protein n=1 Tax=Mycobacterium sp. MAA66 TaxID=3156297 RepID=UPI0035173AC9